MSQLVNNYIQNLEQIFEELRHSIDEQQAILSSRGWRDDVVYEYAVNEMKKLEDKLRYAVDTHDIISEHLKRRG